MLAFVDAFEFRRGAIKEVVEVVRFLEGAAEEEAADGGRLEGLLLDFADVVDLRDVVEGCFRTCEEDGVIEGVRVVGVREAGTEAVEGDGRIVEVDRTVGAPLGRDRIGVERGVGKGR